MNDLVLGMLAGVPIGAGSAALVWVIRQRLTTPPTELTADDREAICSEFQTHAEAMQHQVSQYADALADGDQVLRERLRAFEPGGDRSWASSS